MNYNYTFSSPIKLQDVRTSHQLANQSCNGGFEYQETNSNSKAKKKFIKLYSDNRNGSNYKRVTIKEDPTCQMNNNNSMARNQKLCLCFEGCQTDEIVDFGFTSNVRSVSPDPNRRKLIKNDTPVNELIQLQRTDKPIHYLQHEASLRKWL